MNLVQLSDLARAVVDPAAVVTPVATAGVEALAVKVEAGEQQWCLRLGEGAAFAKDAWAARLFGAVVPVPAVLDAGVSGGQAWCLTEWVEGPTLQDVPAADLPALMPAVIDAWQALQQVDHAGWRGVGSLDPATLVAPAVSLRSSLAELAAQARRWPAEWVADRRGEVELVLGSFRRLLEQLPERRDVIHGDFGTNNLIVGVRSGGNPAVPNPAGAAMGVAAVLDWDCAGIGDSLADIAGRHWQFWPAVHDCLVAQSTAVEQRLGDLPQFELRRLTHDLATGIGEISECLTEGDHPFAQAHLARSLELLEADRQVLAQAARVTP